MNSVVFVVVSLVLGVCLGQQYTTKYDNINIDNILSNDRILSNYIKCILDEGPCTEEGRLLKKHIPDAISTNCVKCTDAQKRIVKKGSSFLIKNKPQQWQRIARKFDPSGQHQAEFQQFLSS
ncbi:ejaculatory bulb-specific protein 3-like [Sitophilus oryzae]|uniref:Ejaculatory bulb-specific protein 3-like n=1 Tax=Sitophilus oryzae TaxID=7048 RepID=A0A6J2Y5A8_SITOR|nr:ejaculatory bulb-specific protein 3-like [Sitophilus oryzae]